MFSIFKASFLQILHQVFDVYMIAENAGKIEKKRFCVFQVKKRGFCCSVFVSVVYVFASCFSFVCSPFCFLAFFVAVVEEWGLLGQKLKDIFISRRTLELISSFDFSSGVACLMAIEANACVTLNAWPCLVKLCFYQVFIFQQWENVCN